MVVQLRSILRKDAVAYKLQRCMLPSNTCKLTECAISKTAGPYICGEVALILRPCTIEFTVYNIITLL